MNAGVAVMIPKISRRRIVQVTTGLAVTGGMALISPAIAQRGQNIGQQETKTQEVTPPEDLMREHGVLDRILLVYEATIGSFENNESFDPSIISKSAQIIRQFIEDYHELNEQNYLFSRFRQAGTLVDLVNVLYQQHQAGRRLTDTITRLAPTSTAPGSDRNQLIGTMQAFIRMYRPHEAREDTVLFPALRSVVTANEFDSMGEDFENIERQKFGEDGFEKVVAQVADLERAIGINDLAKFTPVTEHNVGQGRRNR
jgi:hemerythrin-like domain-containing protein